MMIRIIIGFVILLSAGGHAMAEGNLYLGFYSEYIATIELFQITSKESISLYNEADLIKDRDERDAKILKIISSDSSARSVRCVARMVLEKSKFNTFHTNHYAKQRDDGTYVLVESGWKSGVLIDLAYKNSEDGKVLLKGEIAIAEITGREVFTPFPSAKIGKPFKDFGGSIVWGDFTPLSLNKKIIFSSYTRGKPKDRYEVVVACVLIEPSQAWDGYVDDICNKVAVWPVEAGVSMSGPEPPSFYKARNEERERLKREKGNSKKSMP